MLKLRVTATLMARRGVRNDDKQVDVFIAPNPVMVNRYLQLVWDQHLSKSDSNTLWDLLDPESAITGLSWAAGNEDGMHVAFEIQSAEFAVVDMRGAL
ncbi:MAG: hypothetical protein [Podoviridae sp. ctpVR23]|nr:MAG: hypothetical protein [Podoviridae sp. ctpVR23]